MHFCRALLLAALERGIVYLPVLAHRQVILVRRHSKTQVNAHITFTHRVVAPAWLAPTAEGGLARDRVRLVDFLLIAQ